MTFVFSLFILSYVPKTIPLPTGETLKTTLPTAASNGTLMNGTAMAYIEPKQSENSTILIVYHLFHFQIHLQTIINNKTIHGLIKVWDQEM